MRPQTEAVAVGLRKEKKFRNTLGDNPEGWLTYWLLGRERVSG